MSQLRTRFSPSRWRARLLASAAALAIVLPAVVSSAVALVFGPQTYTRSAGKPVAVKKTFTVDRLLGLYVVHIVNHGVTSAVVSLNGRVAFEPDDFTVRRSNGVVPVPELVRPVVLRGGTNEIVVELRGAPGTSLTIEIAGHSATPTDTTPPTITAAVVPPPNAAGWNKTDVTVTFACADSGSGVAVCPAPMTVSTETAGQVVTGTATDQSGNTATASVTLKIDKTAPVVTASPSPAANANNWNNGPVVVTFAATDAMSGVAPGSLSAPVTLSANGANLSAAGQAIDLAGNTGSVTRGGINIDQRNPTIAVSLTPAPSEWSGTPVTAHFECADDGSGVATCPPDQVISGDGSNQTVTGTAIDNAGNTASVTSAPFSIDLAPPTVTVTLSPAPNTAGWNHTPVTAHFTCADAGAGIASCPPDQVIAGDGANQMVEGEAVDRAGQASRVSAVVNIDRTPPTIGLISPATGSTFFTALVTAAGTASDELSGLASTTCNGTPTVAGSSGFECSVTLAPGANTLLAAAADVAGNIATAALDLTYSRAPRITITSPAHQSYLNITPTTVSGTVDDPTAIVTINSVPAPVVNGSFSLALPVAEGPNIVTATATAATGAIGTASLEVTLDTTPPHVTVTSPPDQFVTGESSISVAGNVNDIVVGTVNAEQAQVTVNGVAAPVANRTFLAANVPLALGPNVIEVVGRDRVGNAATTQVTVVRQTPAHAKIQVVSGNNQSAAISAMLPAPIVVALTDAAGNPAPNTKAIFKVTQNDGQVAGDAAAAATAIATTDERGEARVRWTLGARAGAGANAVEAYAVGFDGTALFSATGTQGAAGQIVVDTGNGQVGAVGQPLPKPFIAVVVDAGNNRLGNVPVTFTSAIGGGTFDGAPSVTVITDPDGRAAATLQLGPLEGNSNNIVHASFPSNSGSPATFMASGRIPGDPAKTTLTGVVLDNSSVPIPGVIVRAVLTNELHSNAAVVQSAIAAQTDAQGQFSIERAPVGLVKVLVDGSTAQRPGSYPSLEYDLVTVAGQNNTVGTPIYLLPLNPVNKLCVTETTGGGTLTMADAPGFSLTFGPGQVTFPGGSKSGCISVTVVHGDKSPMEPTFGQQPRFLVTIQPPGAHFNPPAPITVPNVDGLRPREVTELSSFDHDIGAFVAIGTATVSADGLVIRSNPGVGVLKAGWHFGANPNPRGKAATPGVAVKPEQAVKGIGGQFTVVASGTPADDGVYGWELVATQPGDDTGVVQLVQAPGCEKQASCTAVLKGVKGGRVTLRVHFQCPTTGAQVIKESRITIVQVDDIYAVIKANVGTSELVPRSTTKVPAGALQWAADLWSPANAVVLIRNSHPPFFVKATTTPSAADQAIKIAFDIVRDPADAAAVGTGRPTLAAAANNSNYLTPNERGSFQVLAFIDNNDNKKRDDDEPAMTLPLVLVEATVNRNLSRANSANLSYVRHVDASGSWFASQVKSGEFSLANSGSAAAVYLAAEVDFVGGGADGRRGIDQVFGGWVQTLPIPLDVAGSYRNNHQTSWVFATNPATATGTFLGSRPLFLPTDSAPALATPPLLDSGKPSPGTGGDSSTLSSSRSASTNLTLGQRKLIEAVDSPGLAYLAAHPGFANSPLTSVRFNLTFRGFLTVWSNRSGTSSGTGHLADHTYAVVLEQPWNIRATYGIDAAGNGTPSTPPSVNLPAATTHSPVVPLGATKAVLVPPSGLDLLAVDARR